MKKASICVLMIFLMVLCAFSICGIELNEKNLAVSAFSKSKEDKIVKYFTLHYYTESLGQVKLVVDDNLLKPKWFETETKIEITNGLTIYQRAEVFKNSGRELMSHSRTGDGGLAFGAVEFEKAFPEIYLLIQKLNTQVKKDVANGFLKFNPNLGDGMEDKFWVEGAKDGCQVDFEELSGLILKALVDKKHQDIEIPIEVIKTKSKAQILKDIEVRASYSTRFDARNLNRSNNIEISAEKFNGLVIPNRGVISFNDIVGDRTSDRGYMEANIIVDGEFVKGVGGGVCQTSTTLFNAGILAGLTVKQSANHSIPISYVPLGRDAMVSSAVDLVFENTTGSNIYIESGINNNNRVFFKIYGASKNGVEYRPRVEVIEKEVKQEVDGVIPNDLNINPDSYERVVLEYGRGERVATTYIDIYKGEKLVQRKLVRKSRYKGKEEDVKYEKNVIKNLDDPIYKQHAIIYN